MNHKNWAAQRIYARQRGDIRGYDRSMMAGLGPLPYQYPSSQPVSNGSDQLVLILALGAAGLFLMTR